ncbi:hypothetical protein ACVWW4_005715 [Bradyrhizobium sp. LB7.1]
MRSFLLTASALLAIAATMTFEATDANAVVCARGVYRAGCAGPNAAVVVPQAGSGGPLHQGAGQRGLRKALHLTVRMAKPARFGYASQRTASDARQARVRA